MNAAVTRLGNAQPARRLESQLGALGTTGRLAAAAALSFLCSTSSACSHGYPPSCTLHGAEIATVGSVVRGGVSETFTTTFAHAYAVGEQDEALHEALLDPETSSGDLVWDSYFEGGTLSLALRLPVRTGERIPLATAPLEHGGQTLRPAGEATGESAAALWLHLGKDDSFGSTGVSGEVLVIGTTLGLLLEVDATCTDESTAETVTLDAELVFVPTSGRDGNCN